MQRPFALVDCNNFYASCERVFQPHLRNKPIVVLSNNDGCIIARSNEAKALGIEMGAPWHLNRDRFRDLGVIVRSSNYTLYGDMSARVMRTLNHFSPRLEVYSIDEAFLDLSGFSDLEHHARHLRRIVGQWTGIPVSVGIGPTKTWAKIANRLAKQTPSADGVACLMGKDAQDAALQQIKLTDIWGIARRLAERLAAVDIHTPLDLRAADPKHIRQIFGVVVERIVMELRGQSCLDIEDVAPDRKSLMASRSFGRPVTTWQEMQEAIATYTSRAAEKMRRQNLATAHLLVFVETNSFRPQDRQWRASQSMNLPSATADTARLITAALQGAQKIWRDGYKYKKGGVLLLDLVPADQVQGALFAEADTPSSRARMKALDAINQRFGRGTLTIGSAGLQRAWQLRRDFLSPRYTTEWQELLKV